MIGRAQLEAAVAAKVALALEEPPGAEIVAAVAAGLATVVAPVLVVPKPRAVTVPSTPISTRRAPRTC